MGLLDSVIGSVGGALAGQLNQGLGQALGQGGGSAQLIEGLVRALTSGGAGAGAGAGGGLAGGLAGLVQQLQQGGLGEAAASWVSTGQNLPVSPEQLQQALGPQVLGQLAGSVGLDAGQAAGLLRQETALQRFACVQC